MKVIDSNAIGRLIEEMLQNEAAYPIADREAGYEEDNIQTMTTPITIGGDHSEILLATEKGQQFIISVRPVTP